MNSDSEPAALGAIPQWKKERGILGVNMIPKNQAVKKGSLSPPACWGSWQVKPLASTPTGRWGRAVGISCRVGGR